jgi:hypothetical protein
MSLNTKKEEKIPETFLEKLDYIDRKISGWVHNCVVRPKFLELVIFPFAFLFSPISVLIVMGVVGVFLPRLEET